MTWTRTARAEGCEAVATTGGHLLAQLDDADVAPESPARLADTAAVFRGWRARLAELLERGGLEPDRAHAQATALIAGAVGAVVLARAERDLARFEAVAEQLLAGVRAAR
jgi:hypothetical protein